MRWGLAALVLLLAFTADGQVFGRWNKNAEQRRASGPLLSMALTATGDSECNGLTPAGLTFTRTSAATCTRSDGTVVSLPGNQPRVTARGLLVEGAATNLVLHNRDFTDVFTGAWVGSLEIYCNRTTGVDGVPNSASLCTSTNFTDAQSLTQSLTTAAAVRSTSMYLRPTPGSTVEVTRNGFTWTDVTASLSTSAWKRVAPSCLAGDTNCVAVPALSSSIANPVVGFRVFGSVAVDYVQDEAGALATSPIATAGTSVTRAGDTPSVTTPPGMSVTVGCAALSMAPLFTGNTGAVGAYYLSANGLNTARLGYATSATSQWRVFDGTTATSVATSNQAGVQRRYRTEWEPGRLQVFAVTEGVSGASVAFSAFPFFAPNVTVGHHGGTAHADSYLSNLVLDATTGGCL